MTLIVFFSGALRDVAMGQYGSSPSITCFRWFPAMRTACCEVTFWSCNLRQKMVVVELKCNWMTCHGPKMPRLNGHGPWNGAAWKVNSDFEMFSWKDQRLGTRMWWFDIHRKWTYQTYHICFIWFWGGGCLFQHPFSDGLFTAQELATTARCRRRTVKHLEIQCAGWRRSLPITWRISRASSKVAWWPLASCLKLG